MVSIILVLLAAALIFFAFNLRQLSRRKAEETGVRGSVLYTDADHERPTENLTCELPGGLHMVGKPDYIVKREGRIIPLEYKSSQSPERLYAGYENQIGVYFLLIESRYGKAASPEYGIVRFADGKEFQVKNTDALRARVIREATRMEQIGGGTIEARRNHNSRNKCAACEFFPVCDERLG